MVFRFHNEVTMKGKSDSVRNCAQYCIVPPSYKARILSMKYTDELDDLLRPARVKGNAFIIFKKTHKNVPK